MFFFNYKKSIVIWVELSLTLEVRIASKLVLNVCCRELCYTHLKYV